jgi:ubiquinone/menaquinone biosynthesis C-methylase UbiE
MDVHSLSFPDQHFDSIVDTFGLESYAQPEKAL